MNVEQLGDIAASPHAVLISERAPDEGALLVDHLALLGSGARGTNLPDQVPQPNRRRAPHCRAEKERERESEGWSGGGR